jgi:hypothetical protein
MELNFLFMFFLCSCSWRSLLAVVEVEQAGCMGVVGGVGRQGAFFVLLENPLVPVCSPGIKRGAFVFQH